ncbi:MAG: UvrD-helicase domain-containing protein [Clostridia bacterium]|nr:UvrD-helicase domain-containing protein [Clostridia bacterium]
MSGISWTNSQRLVLDAGGNVLVSASAGSGKTTVMLEKVMLLLKRGCNINRFLIMTFSNASAAEMRDKLVQKLYEEIRAGETSLKRQLELLNFSNICTIDSFCYNLYKSHFADIGLDPSYGLLDAQEAKLLFFESVDTALEAFFEKGEEDFLDLVRRFVRSRDIAPVKDAVRQISEFLDVQTDEKDFMDKTMKMSATPLDGLPAVKYYLKSNRRILKRFESEAKNLLSEYDLPRDKYKDILYDIISYINSIYNKDTIKGLAAALSGATEFGDLRGKKPEGAEELIRRIGALKNAVNKYIEDTRGELSVDFDGRLQDSMRDIGMLLDITVAAREEYRKQKQRKHSFDFADLSRVALKILGNDTRRTQIAAQYDFVFVDEYQDTNYIQEKIMTLVSSKDNLFMVGDPKQAIYQFRHAEPQIFLDRFHRYSHKTEGENCSLNDNFRSDSRVLDFVNLVFNELMEEEFGGVTYRNNAELVAGLTYPEVSKLPAVEIAVFEKEKDKEKPSGLYSVRNGAAEKKQRNGQAVYIADKIKRLVGNEYIYDAGQKTARFAEYRDIAVLMYKRDGEEIIEQLKKSGIPFSAPGFVDTRLHEIEILVDYLRIIDNMASDIPLSAVMQSPIYRFSPLEMLEIRKVCPKTYFWESVLSYSGDQKLKIKIEGLILDLDKRKETAARADVSELLNAIMTDGYNAYLLSRGEEITEQVNNFINGCAGKDYARDIPSFLAFFDNVYDKKASSSASGDAVRLMTIHNSKGLEFPIVFLANAQDGFSATHDINKDIYLDSEFGVAMKYFDRQSKTKKDTVLTAGFKKKAGYREREELLRLMYVAMTRAKNHLFISAESREIKSAFADTQDCFLQWIYAAAEKNARIKDYFASYKVLPPTAEQEEAPLPQKQCQTDKLGWVYPHTASTVMPLKYTVTALREEKGVEAVEKRAYLSPEESINRGVAYHTVMQHINFDCRTLEDLARELADMEEKGIISAEERKSLDLHTLERTLGSDVIALARRSKYKREQPFMLYLPASEVLKDCAVKDRVLVQGVIDLVILGEKNIIVDFKVTQSGDMALKTRYKGQLDMYALAAERLLGITVDRKIIYEITRNVAIDI